MEWEIVNWKDVERFIDKKLRDLEDDGRCIFDVYPDELIVSYSDEDSKDTVSDCFRDHLNLDDAGRIIVEFGCPISVVWEKTERNEHDRTFSPLFRNVIYMRDYISNAQNGILGGVPVVVFHSYKGGVGRTLSLLAFAKSWEYLDAGRKLLIVDSDLEAPGLTWLTEDIREETLSYIDFLEIIQQSSYCDEMRRRLAAQIKKSTIRIESEQSFDDYYFLPAYRYQEQLFDIYTKPESIAQKYGNKFAIAEELSLLGKELGVDTVLVDLRAGISEISAPLLFDTRVQKIIVTSTSDQSVVGTKLLLEQINKGLRVEPDAKIPHVFLSMIPDGVDKGNLHSELICSYRMNVKRNDSVQQSEDESLFDGVIVDLPFSSELIHLASISRILRILESRPMYYRIRDFVREYYFDRQEESGYECTQDRNSAINSIHKMAHDQITAEGNGGMEILLTKSISNLVSIYADKKPCVVILGAKGSGKTFLFKEMIRANTWSRFIQTVSSESRSANDAMIVPMIAPINSSGLVEIMKECVIRYNERFDNRKLQEDIFSNNRDRVLRFNESEHSVIEWKDFWMRQLCPDGFVNMKEYDDFLDKMGENVIFVFDGLEDLLQNVTSSNGTYLLRALCQDVVDYLRVSYRHIGMVIFVRRDMVEDSIETNFAQFYSQYKSFVLNWTKVEALRMVLWLVSKAVPGFYKETTPIQNASEEMIRKALTRLWGNKLGKDNSNEAYSANWILAALSDFNGQLQARDVIRFLSYATSSPGQTSYQDRFIMPKEIREAVPSCSDEKINEIKTELIKIKPILDKIEGKPKEARVLPFYSETFNFTSEEEQTMRREGYLAVDGDKYYLPEILRYALGFRYNRGARPKVLSLMNRT